MCFLCAGIFGWVPAFFNMKKANSMNITREQLKLYAVTDRSWLGSETLYEQVEKALKGGVTLVQLREKTLDEAAFEKEGQELLELCHHYNVPLIINDNVELAKKNPCGRSSHRTV